MNVEVTNLETPCRVKLHIEASAEDIAGDYRQAVDPYVRNAALPGFRRGKAPRELVVRRFAGDINRDFSNNVLGRLYREAVKEKDLSPVAVCDVENMELDVATGFRGDIVVDVAPEFDLPEYKGIKVEPFDTNVTDQMVEDRINGLRANFANFLDHNPGDEYKAAKDDIVKLDYTGAVDGAPLLSRATTKHAQRYAEAKDAWFLAGAEQCLIPEIGERLVGIAAGAEFDVDVTFGDDFAIEEFRGLKAHYAVKVAQVRERVLPALDEEFVKRLNVDSVDSLKDRVRKHLEADLKQQAASDIREKVANYLLEHTSFDVPQTAAAEETRRAVYDIVQNAMRQGMSREQLDDQKDQVQQIAVNSANSRLRLAYILAKIAKAENIEATKAEVTARIKGIAAARNITFEKAVAAVRRENGFDGIETDIRCRKAMDLLVEKADQSV